MWNQVIDILFQGINAAFGWLGDIFASIPGSWDTIFTIIVIMILSRSILGPILGAAFNLGSDRVRRSSSRQNSKSDS